MSWHYLQELVEESSEESSLAGKPCALLSGNQAQEKSCSQDREMDTSTSSLSGTMSRPSTGDRGVDWWMSSLAASRAKTSAQQEREQESVESEAGCGGTWSALYLRCVPDSYSLRTVHCLWDEDLQWSSVTLPRWGMMRNGELWERTTLPVHTQESESGSWPTPRCKMASWLNWDRVESGKHKSNLEDYTAIQEGLTRGSGKWSLNPEWCEWLMAWPIGWTNATEPLATDKFRQWQHSHSSSFPLVLANNTITINRKG